ncbi:MAG TPA: PEP-CTERM sorting domain-containing protein [Isosphaeraceae bacterium]|jgi:hypothetical protein|nr:PEP-CTERM sorting domain-containing protein [Isosphaeraceae bacterium]
MRLFRYAIALASATVLSSLAMISSARADSIFYNFDSYGHAVNNGPYCAATSFANSFRFLEKKYPTVYGTTLTGGNDNPTAARDGIVALETLSGGAGSAPTSHQTVWESKVNYILNNAPAGTTIFEGQQDPAVSTTGWLMANSIQNVNPTLNFLFNQLRRGEDVEIGFTGIPNAQQNEPEDKQDPFSHMVVLTGLDNVTMRMQYLDPNNPTQLFTTTLTSNNGSLFFNWDNGGANTPVNNVRIFQAFAESPSVPEPSSLILAGSGAFLLIGYASRYRKRGRVAA